MTGQRGASHGLTRTSDVAAAATLDALTRSGTDREAALDEELLRFTDGGGCCDTGTSSRSPLAMLLALAVLGLIVRPRRR